MVAPFHVAPSWYECASEASSSALKVRLVSANSFAFIGLQNDKNERSLCQTLNRCSPLMGSVLQCRRTGWVADGIASPLLRIVRVYLPLIPKRLGFPGKFEFVVRGIVRGSGQDTAASKVW